MSTTIDGVKYDSKVKAAQALVAAGKTISETADLTGITYQSVYAYTKGMEKTQGRRARYRILALGKTGNRSPGDIAKKLNVSVPMVIALLKKNGIAIVTKEALAALKPKTEKVKVDKPANTEKVKVDKPAKVKTPKVKKEKVAVASVEFDDIPSIVESDLNNDAAAQAAQADMATENQIS
jgi:DNA-binding CsgD family transcriptional regulator